MNQDFQNQLQHYEIPLVQKHINILVYIKCIYKITSFNQELASSAHDNLKLRCLYPRVEIKT